MPVSKKDGIEQVLIPGGDFFMGSDRVLDPQHEKPMVEVSMSAFLIDRYEVSVAQYLRCVGARECSPMKTEGSPLAKPDLPVTSLTWIQARKYCHWIGGDLPTEAQFEMAMKGKNSLRFPWGANPGFKSLSPLQGPRSVQSTGSGSPSTGPGGFGVFHLHDNVSEWVLDSSPPPVAGSPVPRKLNLTEEKSRKSKNYVNLDPSEFKVVKGANYQTAFPVFHRASFRFALDQNSRKAILGFRCASQP